jgi:hypothetical protein
MSAIREFVTKHPRLTSWFVLALGMVVMLLWAAKDVGLLRPVRVDHRVGIITNTNNPAKHEPVRANLAGALQG